MRIAINGLGRVGRALLRQAVLSEDLEVVAVNDLADPHMLAALLRRDTTYGPFPFEVDAGDDCLVIDGHKVPWSNAKTPAELPWASYAVDVAVECTGKFRTYETAGEHLEAGARKVVISAPGKGVDATIVMGINDADYDPQAPRRRLQRLVHDQLRGADGQGAQRRLRPAAGVHDHRPRLHRRPEPARRPAQGPAPGPLGCGQHHPDHDRRGPRGQPGPSRAGRQARRRGPPGAGRRRLARRPGRPPGPGGHRRGGERRVRGGQPQRRARRPAPLRDRADRLRRRHRRQRLVRPRLRADPGVRPLRQGLRLVRQRVGLHLKAGGARATRG